MLRLLGRLGSQAVHTPAQGQETWVRTRLTSSPWSVFASIVGEGWLAPGHWSCSRKGACVPLAVRALSAFKAGPCVPSGQPFAWPACRRQSLWD